ncbi:E3 ubiquitin-protein ligase ZNRF2-like [Chlorocebus sabaeus]|uniref:E3 ubiquitin-protein ligase ZNRF2-like n=1 Tax=Chlorocebus sabaeus TaxID=60711 RepID=UPI003BF98BA7
MSAKQSGPTAANTRTRACSGSDLLSSSSGGANRTASGGDALTAAARRFPAQVPNAHQLSAAAGTAANSAAPRSRYLGGPVGSVASAVRAAQSSFSIPNSSSGPYSSQDSVHSSPEDGGGGREHRGAAPGDWLLTSSPLAAQVTRLLSLPSAAAPPSCGDQVIGNAHLWQWKKEKGVSSHPYHCILPPTLLLFHFHNLIVDNLTVGFWKQCCLRDGLTTRVIPIAGISSHVRGAMSGCQMVGKTGVGELASD